MPADYCTGSLRAKVSIIFLYRKAITAPDIRSIPLMQRAFITRCHFSYVWVRCIDPSAVHVVSLRHSVDRVNDSNTI